MEKEIKLEGGSDDEIPMKSLPKILQPYHALQIIKDSKVAESEKIALVKQYGLESKEWSTPKTKIAKDFALDMVLLQLTEANNLKVGTYVNL